MNVAEHPPAYPVPWTARRRPREFDDEHLRAASHIVCSATPILVYAQHWYAARAEAAKLFCCPVEDVVVERAIG